MIDPLLMYDIVYHVRPFPIDNHSWLGDARLKCDVLMCYLYCHATTPNMTRGRGPRGTRRSSGDFDRLGLELHSSAPGAASWTWTQHRRRDALGNCDNISSIHCIAVCISISTTLNT